MTSTNERTLHSLLYHDLFMHPSYNENSFVTHSIQGRILALDVGKRRIGLALSDELRLTAQGIETLERTNIRQDVAALSKIAAERNVMRFLVGNPMNMSGTEGRQAEWVRQFASTLKERTGIPVELWDERLTTVEAGRVLRQSGIGIEKRARAIDRLSAVLLLQSYLDALSLSEAEAAEPEAAEPEAAEPEAAEQ